VRPNELGYDLGAGDFFSGPPIQKRLLAGGKTDSDNDLFGFGRCFPPSAALVLHHDSNYHKFIKVLIVVVSTQTLLKLMCLKILEGDGVKLSQISTLLADLTSSSWVNLSHTDPKFC
jgi:hypothetical protein